MKITFYNNPGCQNETSFTRNYELVNCSVEELTKALIAHCELLEADPFSVAVTFPKGEFRECESEYIIKGTSTNMSMKEVAVEILKLVANNTTYKVVITDDESKFEFVLCEKNSIEDAQKETENFVQINHFRDRSITILDEHGPCMFGMTVNDDDEVEWSKA